jgi:hypothetical protein
MTYGGGTSQLTECHRIHGQPRGAPRGCPCTGIYQDIKMHVQTCLTCQQWKWSPTKPTPLSPLPIPECPNWRIHADLFGPMLAADSNKKFVLCITDAFTKYTVITSIQNKNAETVADAIFKEWFCKFGIPAQIHTDGWKKFVNKLAAEMMELLNVAHTKTSPAHPQCNSQVEVFKTVKKYLASFVDDTALNWERFLPALWLSYNTSYNCQNSIRAVIQRKSTAPIIS